MPKALVLAGTHSGCGKTSLTLGLVRALARRGLTVQPFKTGPDFIDPGLHAAAAGRPSHNLDTWMMPESAVCELFARHAQVADIAVVEGVMGLFDGRDGLDEQGSTAHLAELLGLPVVLVVDAGSQARSIAALVHGFTTFDSELPLAGVLLNRVGSERHETILRQALTVADAVPVLGCLRRSEALALPARHLGLVTVEDAVAENAAGLEATLNALADWVERSVDIPALLASLPELPQLKVLRAADSPPSVAPSVRLGLARDRAFCFVYEENLRLLEAAGAEIVPFSPLAAADLPPNLDGLLLPGGYPELTARQLSANKPMLQAIRAFCASGKPVWAECGGYMYLMRELIDVEGRAWPLCGVVPARAHMTGRRAALGYRTARTLRPGPLGPAGTVLRGHEFHYSQAEMDEQHAEPRAAWSLIASDGACSDEGWCCGSVIGGYFHMHLASNPEVAQAFVTACRKGGGEG